MDETVAPCTALTNTAAFDAETGQLRVVIETPKGSRNKYGYRPDLHCLELRTVLPEGMSFPYDFGFVPSTLGDDGDPLDILVLMDAPVVPLCLIKTRLVGVIEARQREKGKEWLRNDRLIAVAVHARTHADVHRLHDLRPGLIEEIQEFFRQYNRLGGKKFKPIGIAGPGSGRALVERGMQAFKDKLGRTAPGQA